MGTENSENIISGCMKLFMNFITFNLDYSSHQRKIVGGVETGVNEYPMMVGLVDPYRREVYCGGSIISLKHVLTAAHCVTDRSASSVGVLVGDHDLTTGKCHYFFTKET